MLLNSGVGEVLEKTLESPLDCEIQPVNAKGNQSWIFIGRTDAEAETSILWPPDVKNWLIRKDPDAGKDWRWEKKGMTGGNGWMASQTGWTWVWASSQSWWWTGKPGLLQSMGSQRAGHDWATELNWTWDFTSVIFSLQVYDPSLTTKKHQTSSSQGTSNNILYQYSSKVLRVLTL